MDSLIERYLEPYPGRPGPAEWRLKVEAGGVPVWALIGALPEDGSNIERIARDFEVPLDAVRAAWAYYQRHKVVIDVKIAETSY